MKTAEQQYLELCKKIIEEGEWVNNERTGKRCLTIINHDIEYDCSDETIPLLTTKKSYWKSAIAELIGYLRGYDSAADFRSIGCKTWDANANQNEAWLNNPNRKGEDDMGFVYGAVARNYPVVGSDETIDLLKNIIDDLSKGIDNRGEILTFYHPGSFHLGCLRPCMFNHHFSILGGKLYLNSYQRSCDVPLGLGFNMLQVVMLLRIVAQITGLKPGKAYHKIVNAHIYEDQLELMRDVQMKREPFEPPKLFMTKDLKTLNDLETWLDPKNPEHFRLEGYKSHDPIKYPFAV